VGGQGLSLEVTRNADAVTVRISGDVDLASKERLEEAIGRLGPEARFLIFDLAGVTFMSSTGINMLVRVHNLCEANGGSLVVAAPSEPVRRVLALTGIDQHLTIAD
jgi:anti-anti-sigma factor